MSSSSTRDLSSGSARGVLLEVPEPTNELRAEDKLLKREIADVVPADFNSSKTKLSCRNIGIRGNNSVESAVVIA